LASAASFHGKVIGVSDGDTITVRRDTGEVKVRLHGVDAPEKDQPFGKTAAELTSKLALGKKVTVDVVSRSDDGRTVARVTFYRALARGAKPVYTDLSLELVLAGLAWWDRKHAPDDKDLAAQEAAARAAKEGLWADEDPVPPWAWRSGKRRSPKATKRPSVPPPPELPWSADRICKVHRDCVFAYHFCRPCPACKPRWRGVTNRWTYARHKAKAERQKPRCARCRRCPDGKSYWLGTKARCVKGQCVASHQPAR
jgi:endonuclease YncB( thermonuclease family)